MSQCPRSPITRLAPEILLMIFSLVHQGGYGKLTAALVCCKTWHPLCKSILYGDIVLNRDRLEKFLAYSNHDDGRIQSLSLPMGTLRNCVQQTDMVATAHLDNLRRIGQRIKNMTSLTSLSISGFARYNHAPFDVIFSMLEELPSSCTSLEVDIKLFGLNCPTGGVRPWLWPHLCDAIRRRLPQLIHLRLRLPRICSLLCSVMVDGCLRAQEAPALRHFVVNISQHHPGQWDNGANAKPCDAEMNQAQDHTPLPSLLAALGDFSRQNPSLRRLWVIENLPMKMEKMSRRSLLVAEKYVTWGAWIRRDILADTSFPIPINDTDIPSQDACFARIPVSGAEESGDTEDWLAFPWALEVLAEGCVWSETAMGMRLPMSTMAARGYENTVRAMTRAEFSARSHFRYMLWTNEAATGETLLPRGPGPLMQKWDLREATPHGWRRIGPIHLPLLREKKMT